MSVDYNVYAGVYIKAYLPTEIYKEQELKCPKCNGDNNKEGLFCSKCGTKKEISEIIKGEYAIDLEEIEKNAGIDEGTFMSIDNNDNDDEDSTTIISNDDSESNSSFYCEGNTEYTDIPKNKPDENWQKLFNYFKTKKIKYKRYYGIITYCS